MPVTRSSTAYVKPQRGTHRKGMKETVELLMDKQGRLGDNAESQNNLYIYTEGANSGSRNTAAVEEWKDIGQLHVMPVLESRRRA